MNTGLTFAELKDGMQIATFLPELVILATAVVILMFGVFQRRSGSNLEYLATQCLAMGGLIVSAAALIYLLPVGSVRGFFGAWEVSQLGTVTKLGVLAATFLAILSSGRWLKNTKTAPTEFVSLVLFSVLGMMVMIGARELLTFFLGLEILSLPLYVLCCFRHEEKLAGNEAGLKYFILGSFSSAFFLFGVALAYGAFRTTNLFEISGQLAHPAAAGNMLLQLKTFAAFAMMAIGLSFKVSLFPFQFWTPDVYQGAPTPVTAFMASGVKIAGFVALINLAVVTFGHAASSMSVILSAICLLTMFFANFAALRQLNVKRMLAYSSVSHAGYIMIGIIAAARLQEMNVDPLVQGGDLPLNFLNTGMASVAFYVIAYAIATVGAFALISFLDHRKDEGVTNDSIRGLGFKKPLFGVLLALFMFNLAGIPPMVGFLAKFYIFVAAIDAGYLWLAIIGAINSMIAVYYYLRVVVALYMRQEGEDAIEADPAKTAGFSGMLAVSLCGILVLALGILPRFVMHWIEQGSKFSGG